MKWTESVTEEEYLGWKLEALSSNTSTLSLQKLETAKENKPVKQR
jgi:hypothetical protein